VPRFFLGRADVLRAIEDQLAAGTKVALHGIRGVGKTALAAAFAMRHQRRYEVIWWIDAATPASVKSGLVSLALRLGWISEHLSESEVVAEINANLQLVSSNTLLIFDNGESLKVLSRFSIPNTTAHVIVTSNSKAWRRLAGVIEIRSWPPETGATYLCERSGRTGEHEAATLLSIALGGLPLALEQAAAYCEQLAVSFPDYLRRFNESPLRMLASKRYADAHYRKGRTTVAKTFALAIDAARRRHPGAEPLITRAALMAEEAIPLFIFSEGRQFLADGLGPSLEGDGLDEALSALTAFSLVDIEEIPDEYSPGIVTRSIRLHRLIRLVAAGRRDAAARQVIASELIKAVKTVYPRDVDDDILTWQTARRLDVIAADLVFSSKVPPGSEEEASWLLDRLATYRHLALGDYAHAEAFHRKALDLDQRHFGESHPHVAADLNNLAELMRACGKLQIARGLYEQAKKIYQADPDTNASRLANIDSNLAELLKTTGNYAEAEPLYRKAIDLEESRPDPDFVSLAKYIGNLSILLGATQNWEEAESLIQRAIVINVRQHGKYHPSVAGDLNTFAEILKTRDQIIRAERIYRSALKIAKRCLPPRHPNLVVHIGNFAEFLRTTNRPRQAEPMFREALDIARAKKLPGDIATATMTYRLALALNRSEEPHAAKNMLAEALKAFLTFAKSNNAVHPKMSEVIASYVQICRNEFGLSEQQAQHEISRLANGLGMKLTF
jgi:tetratricopeptide (TPR) repeat protein